MTQKLAHVGEFGLINRIRALAGASARVIKGIGDDTAVLPYTSSEYLLLTTDMLVEGVHFTKAMPARGIGHKAIAASISDTAAMGGVGAYAVISLGVPATCPSRWINALYQGMRQCAQRYKISIVGGDTVRSKNVIISVALTGTVNKKEVVYRNGARPGDQIFVTGKLGRSLASGRHLRFDPRIRESQFLVKHFKPTSMIDISDGLAADLGHILEESKAGAILNARDIPCRAKATLPQALQDGEDFELLFTLPQAKARQLEKLKQKKFTFYRIGEITDVPPRLRLRLGNGSIKTIQTKGYTHF